MLALLGLSLGACERVIDIDLNDAEPTLVVEALVDNELGPKVVVLTQTTSFFTPEAPSAVTGATVTVTDNTGEVYEYTEAEDGAYVAFYQGIPEREYTLTIVTADKTYTGTSYMRAPVTLDSLSFSPSGGFGGPSEGPPQFLTFINFNDPAQKGNFYRVVEIDEEEPFRSSAIYVLDDLATNGNNVRFPLFGNPNPLAAEVTIELWHLDKAAHTYFDELSDLGGGGPFNSGTPANPTNTLDNGALGYFVAYSKSSVTAVVVPPTE